MIRSVICYFLFSLVCTKASPNNGLYYAKYLKENETKWIEINSENVKSFGLVSDLMGESRKTKIIFILNDLVIQNNMPIGIWYEGKFMSFSYQKNKIGKAEYIQYYRDFTELSEPLLFVRSFANL